MSERGFFEIGIFRGKTPANVGTLWRSAYQMGAQGIFTIGRRYPNQASDTCAAYRSIPNREYLTFDSFWAALPQSTLLVGVEFGGRDLTTFTHPAQAVYLLGAEDSGIPPHLLARCHLRIALPACRSPSYNVAVAGSLVMYDRQTKRGAWHATA